MLMKRKFIKTFGNCIKYRENQIHAFFKGMPIKIIFLKISAHIIKYKEKSCLFQGNAYENKIKQDIWSYYDLQGDVDACLFQKYTHEREILPRHMVVI